MAASPESAGAAAVRGATEAELRLERGELLVYPVCPFPLPQGDDHQFLLAQRLGSRLHKNISYDPASGRVAGFRHESPAQADRLRKVLAAFSRGVTGWLAAQFPRYAAGWRPDRVSFRPEEEATRALRLTARNDLLHVDSFPTRPSRGWRLLRVFANVNPTEPRVWVTSVTFPRLLARFGDEVGLPGRQEGWLRVLKRAVRRASWPGGAATDYDEFMQRLHDHLKGVPGARPEEVLAVRARLGVAGVHRRLQLRRAAGAVRAGALVLRRPCGAGATGRGPVGPAGGGGAAGGLIRGHVPHRYASAAMRDKPEAPAKEDFKISFAGASGSCRCWRFEVAGHRPMSLPRMYSSSPS